MKTFEKHHLIVPMCIYNAKQSKIDDMKNFEAVDCPNTREIACCGKKTRNVCYSRAKSPEKCSPWHPASGVGKERCKIITGKQHKNVSSCILLTKVGISLISDQVLWFTILILFSTVECFSLTISILFIYTLQCLLISHDGHFYD